MRAACRFWGTLGVVAMAACWSPVRAEPAATTLNFAVMRNGAPIGSSVVKVHLDGGETVAQTTTHIQVKFAMLTVYRFDQTVTERWAAGKLVALNSLTDNNGTVHKVSAASRGGTLAVDSDGKRSDVDPTLIPANLWDASLLHKTRALDPENGRIMSVSVVDRGEEQLVLQGRPMTAHHYSIDTAFPQDVWYDQRQLLVQVELHVGDGSRILYRRG
jgi:hypothetical protein